MQSIYQFLEQNIAIEMRVGMEMETSVPQYRDVIHRHYHMRMRSRGLVLNSLGVAILAVGLFLIIPHQTEFIIFMLGSQFKILLEENY